MSEGDSLLGGGMVSLETFVNDQRHKINLDELLRFLCSSQDGLSTEAARERRQTDGINYIDPPISLPSALLCCFLPCISSTASMKKYHETIPDSALAKRNGKWMKLDGISIVPGDIIRITASERVPADMRLFKATNCVFDASAVMGKGVFVRADVENEKVTREFLDSPNIAFMGYVCTLGECIGVVISTGKKTFLSHLISQGHWPPN